MAELTTTGTLKQVCDTRGLLLTQELRPRARARALWAPKAPEERRSWCSLLERIPERRPQACLALLGLCLVGGQQDVVGGGRPHQGKDTRRKTIKFSLELQTLGSPFLLSALLPRLSTQPSRTVCVHAPGPALGAAQSGPGGPGGLKPGLTNQQADISQEREIQREANITSPPASCPGRASPRAGDPSPPGGSAAPRPGTVAFLRPGAGAANVGRALGLESGA